MKISLFGYNRKQTDEYFKYLLGDLKALRGEIEKNNAEMAVIRTIAEDYKKTLVATEEILKVNNEQIAVLTQKVEVLEAEKAELVAQVEELKEKAEAAETEDKAEQIFKIDSICENVNEESKDSLVG